MGAAIPMKKRFYDVSGRYIYRGIALWMQRTQTTLGALAEQTGISDTALLRILKGYTPSPGKHAIDTLLAVTGLTYEEAFRQAERRAEERKEGNHVSENHAV